MKKINLQLLTHLLIFIQSNSYGIAPSNTTLTVRYLTGGGVGSNVPANSVTTLDTANSRFNNIGLNTTTANYVFGTLAANNLMPLQGVKMVIQLKR